MLLSVKSRQAKLDPSYLKSNLCCDECILHEGGSAGKRNIFDVAAINNNVLRDFE